jgi:hypothetical protein
VIEFEGAGVAAGAQVTNSANPLRLTTRINERVMKRELLCMIVFSLV